MFCGERTDYVGDQSIFKSRANQWARGIIDVLETEYPAAMHHVNDSADDVLVIPNQLHPSFWGAYDWHSSVHMQCTAVRLLDYVSDEQVKTELSALLSSRLTSINLEIEREYLLANPAYERPYGWAWIIQLAAECQRSKRPEAETWVEAIGPLVRTVSRLFIEWLPTMSAPIRHGVHDNTAFSMFLALEAGRAVGLYELNDLISEYACKWFQGDVNYPVQWEFSGHDFLSPGLSEALLMQQVLGEHEFSKWVSGFYMQTADAIERYLEVPEINDLHDGKQSHLFGLALTKAWMLLELCESLPVSIDQEISSGAQRLITFAEGQLVGADFMSTHWLITYAVRAQLAMTNF